MYWTLKALNAIFFLLCICLLLKASQKMTARRLEKAYEKKAVLLISAIRITALAILAAFIAVCIAIGGLFIQAKWWDIILTVLTLWPFAAACHSEARLLDMPNWPTNSEE